MRVRILSGCCAGAPMGRSDIAKKQYPRGVYFGCMKCGAMVSRADAAYQIRVMRRTVREIGYTILREIKDRPIPAEPVSAGVLDRMKKAFHW